MYPTALGYHAKTEKYLISGIVITSTYKPSDNITAWYCTQCWCSTVPFQGQCTMRYATGSLSDLSFASIPLIPPGPSRCLDAFIIALAQATSHFTWYTSTKQLQLASLQFCVACRNTTAMALSVDHDTPIQLWAEAAVRKTRSAKRFSVTRVACRYFDRAT